MQRQPIGANPGHGAGAPPEGGDRPLTMLETALFFGVLALIFDGVGAVIGRASGAGMPLCLCGTFLVTLALCAAAGFVGARYTAVVNGVWAGIMVAALDAVFGQLIYLAVLPGYRELALRGSQLPEGVSSGALTFAIVSTVVIGAVFTILGGAFWGFIGAALSQSRAFRPKTAYAEEY